MRFYLDLILIYNFVFFKHILMHIILIHIIFKISSKFSLNEEQNQIIYIRLFLKLFTHQNIASIP
jgi:hypothetical protein